MTDYNTVTVTLGVQAAGSHSLTDLNYTLRNPYTYDWSAVQNVTITDPKPTTITRPTAGLIFPRGKT